MAWIVPYFSFPLVKWSHAMHHDFLPATQWWVPNCVCDLYSRICLWCECWETRWMHSIDSVLFLSYLRPLAYGSSLADRFSEWESDPVGIQATLYPYFCLHSKHLELHHSKRPMHYVDVLLGHREPSVKSSRIWKYVFACKYNKNYEYSVLFHDHNEPESSDFFKKKSKQQSGSKKFGKNLFKF